MLMHDYCQKIAQILSKGKEETLYKYLVHSTDDNYGFLRTRFCYWDKELPNKKIKNINTALLSLNSPCDFSPSTNYYENVNVKAGTGTVLKVQLFYFDLSDKKKFRDMARWSARVGFPYSIKIDMLNETFEELQEFYV